MLKNLRIVALAALAFLALGSFADAASVRVCSPSSPGAQLGPAQVKAVTSGTLYSTNSRGCVVIALTDLADFQAMGYIPNAELQPITYTTGVPAGATTDFVIGTIPPGAYIREIIVNNTVATSVTGGIAFGTTANATDIVTALTCGSSCLTFVTDANLKLRTFSTTASQAIHMAAVTSWQAANITVTLIYGFF